MSSGKNILVPFLIINNGDMASEIISSVVDISKIDNTAVQLIWTGNAEGEFFLEGCLNYAKADTAARVANAGTWIPITLPTPAIADGASDEILLDLNQLAFPYARIRYEPGVSPGTGTLNAWVSGKGI